MSQGKLTVPSIDDREDMQFADEAFDILGELRQPIHWLTIFLSPFRILQPDEVRRVQEHRLHDAHGQHDQGLRPCRQRGAGRG